MIALELRLAPVFAGVEHDALLIVAAGGVTEIAAGAAVAGPAGMVVVLEGEVEVEIAGGAPCRVVEGGFFGELPLLTADAAVVERVAAVTDARLVVVPEATFEFLLETQKPFARALLADLAARLG